jgi:type II secretory pathway pseudopilin PulG
LETGDTADLEVCGTELSTDRDGLLRDGVKRRDATQGGFLAVFPWAEAHGYLRMVATRPGTNTGEADGGEICSGRAGGRTLLRPGRARSAVAGFSLVEILLVTVLLSLIMLALMSVFNTTQAAFRASITQTDVLEGSRATMDLLTGDLRQMVASGGTMGTNRNRLLEPGFTVNPDNLPSGPVNFWVSDPAPTVAQALIGTSPSTNRDNQVQSVFILTKLADVWKGVGYFVDTNSTTYIYPLYRYDSSLMPGRPTPYQIFSNFCLNASYFSLPVNPTNVFVHHLLDGVLHFNVRAYDTNGVVLTNGYGVNQSFNIKNARFYNPVGGEVPMYMCSNTLPAAVEIQMGVMEDRILQRAASMPMKTVGQINYLSQQAGKLHLFRQRVNIPNVDPAAYQP